MVIESPCERIVWDVLPAIRAAIAVELVGCGVAQEEVARMLEILLPRSPSTCRENAGTVLNLRTSETFD